MTSHVAKIVEIVGSSEKSWHDAAQVAVDEAKKTVRGIKGLEVQDMLNHERIGRTRVYRIDRRRLRLVQEWLAWFDK